MHHLRILLFLMVPLVTGVVRAEEPVVISVFHEPVGATMRYVGYNQGHFMPAGNASNWLAHSGVNALRFWASTQVYATDKDLDSGRGITDFPSFQKRKAALRKNPEGERFLNWPAIHERFENLVYPGSNRYVLNPLLDDLKKLQVTPIAQLHSIRWGETWQEHWVQWQRFYAVAYHLARYGDAELFMMFNEPDHPHSGGYSVDEYIVFLQIASDAVRSAVEDVNRIHGKDLVPKILAPVTAGLPTSEWGQKPMASLRTGLGEQLIEHNLFDIFTNHRYGPTWDRYAEEIDAMKVMMRKHSPGGQVLPIIYTEWGRYTTNRWQQLDDTLDTPYVVRDIAAIYGAALEREVLGMVTFKFNNTSRSQYPDGMKSGHHFVREEENFDTTGERRTAEVVRLFAKGFSGGDRPVYRTDIGADGDPVTLQAWTSFDPERKLFAIWCVNLSNDAPTPARIDLSRLPVQPGAFASVEEVSATAFGEVTDILRVPDSKSLALTLPPHGVQLITIPSGEPAVHRRVVAAAMREIPLPVPSALKNGVSGDFKVLRSPAHSAKNRAVLLRFTRPPDSGEIQRALVRVHSTAVCEDDSAVLQIHAIPNLGWQAGVPDLSALSGIIDRAGYVSGSGFKSIPAGHVTFDGEGGFRAADITPALHRLGAKEITLLLIAPLRQPEDREEAEVAVPLSPMDGPNAPVLELFFRN